MEKWDVYNEEGKRLEGELIRGEAIPKGQFHLVVQILVVHTDGSILVMQRDYEKESHPGEYEASAGGSVLKGETSKQGALRELKEETGIEAEVKYIGSFINDKRNSIFHQYISVTDCAKESIVLQKGETIGYKWLSQDEFFEFICTDAFVQRQRDKILSSKNRFMREIEDALNGFMIHKHRLDK